MYWALGEEVRVLRFFDISVAIVLPYLVDDLEGDLLIFDLLLSWIFSVIVIFWFLFLASCQYYILDSLSFLLLLFFLCRFKSDVKAVLSEHPLLCLLIELVPHLLFYSIIVDNKEFVSVEPLEAGDNLNYRMRLGLVIGHYTLGDLCQVGLIKSISNDEWGVVLIQG